MTSPWLCDSLRLSALWRAPTGAESTLSWEAVAGGTPETQDSQPRQGTTRVVGPIGDGARSLERRTFPGRVDWLMLPYYTPAMLFDLARSIPSIGQVSEALQLFDALLFEKAADAYEAPRLALALTAIHPATDRDASYAELKTILSTISPDLNGATDFHYQINRPRPSTVLGGVAINRLARWSSVVMAGVTMVPILSPTSPGVTSQVQSPAVNATRIELDLSTSIDRELVLPREARAPLLREMAALAAETVRDGDRA